MPLGLPLSTARAAAAPCLPRPRAMPARPVSPATASPGGGLLARPVMRPKSKACPRQHTAALQATLLCSPGRQHACFMRSRGIWKRRSVASRNSISATLGSSLSVPSSVLGGRGGVWGRVKRVYGERPSWCGAVCAASVCTRSTSSWARAGQAGSRSQAAAGAAHRCQAKLCARTCCKPQCRPARPAPQLPWHAQAPAERGRPRRRHPPSTSRAIW